MASDPSIFPNEEPAILNNQAPTREHQDLGDDQLEQSQKSLSRDQTLDDLPTTEPEPEPEPEVRAQSLCPVCGLNPPKYKCPQCYLPYCSVACNKIHRENHPPDPEPEPKAKQVPQVPQNSIIADAPDPFNPFRALETSEALKRLFTKYPSLPTQLLEIHAATLPPKEAPDKIIPASLMQGFTKKDGWNHDVGIKNGKAALRKAKRDAGQAGEAIREYTELVLHIMNEASQKQDSTTYFQQQAAMEDTKLIERLMAEEQQRR